MQTCKNKTLLQTLEHCGSRAISIRGEGIAQGVVAPSPNMLETGLYIFELGAPLWECELKVRSNSQAVIIITVPPMSESLHITLRGTITVGAGSTCTIAYASYRKNCSLENRLEYHVEEKAALINYYLINLEGLEDFQELFFLQKQAELSVKALVCGSQEEKKIFRPKVCHLESGSRSQTTVRALLKDKAHASLSGLIDVRPGASCDAHYHNKNLLLSSQASVHAEPQLAIFFDDLACSHGVAIGPLDLDQILYLRTRGLSEIAARRLVLQAFVAEILEDFPQAARAFVEHFYEHDMMETQ